MKRSQRIRLRDIREIDRLVYECLELWADPDEWRMHLVRGITRLAGATVGGCDHRRLSPAHPQGISVGVASCGWPDDRTRTSFHSALDGEPGSQGMPRFDRVINDLFGCGSVTVWRGEVVDDREFHDSTWFQGVFEPHGIYDGLISVRFDPRPQHMMFISCNRMRHDPPYTPRQRTMLRLIHDAIMPFVGKRLALEDHASMKGLTPRRREALEWLLDGLPEKDIAQRMDISPATAHQYIGELYRHFGVNSRPELMAYFIHRRPR